MKYVIYSLVMLTGYGLTYGLLPLILPSWLAVDMILILILCIAQVTKDYTAPVIGVCTGVIIDIFVSVAFGLNTLIYGAFGYFYAKMSFKFRRDSFITAVIAVFIFYILKDSIYMLYCLVYGTNFPYFKVMWAMTLPSALLNAGVGFVVYLLIVKLHELRSLKAKRELDFLKSYREQTDWLANWFEHYK